MRKLTLTLAAAGAALAFAAPASAQNYGAQYYGAPYAPQQPYGYGSGQPNVHPAQRLQMRVDALKHFVKRLDRTDRVSKRKVADLKREVRSIDRRLRDATVYGLNPIAASDIERRLGRLEQKVSYAMIQGYGRDYGWYDGHHGGSGYGYGYGSSFDDDDRRWGDGRHDRDRDWDDDRDH